MSINNYVYIFFPFTDVQKHFWFSLNFSHWSADNTKRKHFTSLIHPEEAREGTGYAECRSAFIIIFLVHHKCCLLLYRHFFSSHRAVVQSFIPGQYLLVISIPLIKEQVGFNELFHKASTFFILSFLLFKFVPRGTFLFLVPSHILIQELKQFSHLLH